MNTAPVAFLFISLNLNIRLDLYLFCGDAFIWTSVNLNRFNQLNIRSVKTHEVIRCKQTQREKVFEKWMTND